MRLDHDRDPPPAGLRIGVLDGTRLASDDPTFLLVQAVQNLSLARDIETIQSIVRTAARRLTGADGATFVLRDGDDCFYADEDAIAPLWKGLRFPMAACVSGWVMTHGKAAVIEDVFADDRVPGDAYKPTFVQGMAMVPIRSEAPIGAIGNYWASRHAATEGELRLLQALADSTSIALENVRLYCELERRVAERTEALQAANRELEAFSYSVSHDLRAPLRAVDGFARILAEDHSEKLGAEGRRCLGIVLENASHMGRLIEDLLEFSRMGRTEAHHDAIDMASLVRSVADDLRRMEPERRVDLAVDELPRAHGDRAMIHQAVRNLLGNAWKFTASRERAHVRVTARREGSLVDYVVHDDGVGFPPERAEDVFEVFRRVHSDPSVPGTGVGLAIVRRVAERHGGRAWAESRPGEGATFHLVLPGAHA